jgi:hypothetical protein
VFRVRILGDADDWASAASFMSADPDVASVTNLDDGRLDLGITGDDQMAAALLFRAMSEGHRVVSFAPVASDLEELFLQITAPADVP